MGKDLKGKELGKGISQRKDKRYEARAVINGTKIDIYDFNLENLIKEFNKEKERIKSINNDFNNIDTLKEWYIQWFTKAKAPSLKTEQSRRTYNRKINNTYIRLLGDKKIKNLKQMDIQTATNELLLKSDDDNERSYSQRTVKEALGVLKECLDIAVINQIIPVNVCINISFEDENLKPEERRVLTYKEQKRFLEEASSSYYYEAYCILLCTGMRIGEFSGLQWSDIDFNKKVININRSMKTEYLDGKKTEILTTPKTSNSYREIPFFGETEFLLKKWKAKQDIYKKKLGDRWRANPEFGNLVFTSTMGSPVTRYVLAHDIRKLIREINMKEIMIAMKEGREPIEFKGLYPHAFRHTFATRCFEKGMEPITVQKIMGHANYVTTVSYTHLLEEKMSKEVKSIGDFLA